jgi:hypothetical protein
MTIRIAIPEAYTRLRDPGSSNEAETTTLTGAMSVFPTELRVGAINALIAWLKATHVFELLDGLWVLAAHDAQAARLNWVARTFDLTAINAPTFTIDRGYTGDGSTSYLTTAFNPTTAPSPKFVLDSATVGVWSRTDYQVGASAYDIGWNDGAYATFASFSSAANVFRGAINTNALADYGANLSTEAHWTLTRTASALTQAFVNGAQHGTDNTGASVAIPNSNLRILSSDAANFSPRQIAAAYIGSGLTAANIADLHTGLQNYMTAVGA